MNTNLKPTSNLFLIGNVLSNKPRSLVLILILFLFVIALPHDLLGQSTDTITNKTIIALSRAGIGKTVITAKINTSPCNFDLSTDGLIFLKKNGVPDDIVAIMLSKGNSLPAQSAVQPVQNATDNAQTPSNGNNTDAQPGSEAALQPGLYYFEAKTNSYSPMGEAETVNKSGTVGEAMLQGISPLFNTKLKEAIAGHQANLKVTNPRPLFVLVIDTTNNQAGPLVKTPDDIALIALTQEKHYREFVIGKTNATGTTMAVDNKTKVPFTSTGVQNGMWEITFDKPLPRGEYGFTYAGQAAQDGSIAYIIYDFSMDVPGTVESRAEKLRNHHH